MVLPLKTVMTFNLKEIQGNRPVMLFKRRKVTRFEKRRVILDLESGPHYP